MSFQVEGKVAVVTGGSSGIGLAAVEILVAEGAKVAWCGRDEQRLVESKLYILEKYPHAHVFTQVCNVLDKEDVKNFAHTVKQHLGNVDMLINNAGQGRVSTFENTQDEDWMKEIELKYFSVLHPIRAFLVDLKNSAITAIVLIESLVHLLKNENVDISTVKITIGNKKDGIESPEIQLQQLIDISLKELLEIKNGEKS